MCKEDDFSLFLDFGTNHPDVTATTSESALVWVFARRRSGEMHYVPAPAGSALGDANLDRKRSVIIDPTPGASAKSTAKRRRGRSP